MFIRNAGNFNFKTINRPTGSPARNPGSWICSTSKWCPWGGGHSKGWSTDNLPGHDTPRGRKQSVSKNQNLQARFERRLWQWPTLHVRECHLQLGVNKLILFAARGARFNSVSINFNPHHYRLDQFLFLFDITSLSRGHINSHRPYICKQELQFRMLSRARFLDHFPRGVEKTWKFYLHSAQKKVWTSYGARIQSIMQKRNFTHILRARHVIYPHRVPRAWAREIHQENLQAISRGLSLFLGALESLPPGPSFLPLNPTMFPMKKSQGVGRAMHTRSFTCIPRRAQSLQKVGFCSAPPGLPPP